MLVAPTAAPALCSDGLGLGIAHTFSIEEEFCLHFSVPFAEEFGIYLVK